MAMMADGKSVVCSVSMTIRRRLFVRGGGLYAVRTPVIPVKSRSV